MLTFIPVRLYHTYNLNKTYFDNYSYLIAPVIFLSSSLLKLFAFARALKALPPKYTASAPFSTAAIKAS